MRISRSISSMFLALALAAAPTSEFSEFTLKSYAKISTCEASKAQQEDYQQQSAPKWIDRIDWTEREYGVAFYKQLETACVNNGPLIDVSQGCTYTQHYQGTKSTIHYMPIVTITGMAPSRSAAEEIVSREVATAVQYIGLAYTAFDRDHSEVFWLTGKAKCIKFPTYTDTASGCTYEVKIGFILKNKDFDVRAPEYQDVSKINETISLRDKLVADILQSSPKTTRYEQLEYFNNYLASKNQYNTSPTSKLLNLPIDCYECISALKGTTGTDGPICGAYSQALKVLCDEAKIPCVVVLGSTSSRNPKASSHEWNLVQMEDNNWYAIDVTWNSSMKSNSDWFLVGSDTVVHSVVFSKFHIENSERLGMTYEGGPVLHPTAYSPISYSKENL